MSGPTVVPGAEPAPTTREPKASASPRANSSATDSCTRNRFAATHVCPALRILAATAPWTAAGTSASANTRNGAFPPSSIEVRSTPSAAPRSRCWPTSVDPVNESLRSRGSASKGATRDSEEEVGTTLRIPVGRPRDASSARTTSAKSIVVNGVKPAGLTTTVHPAARAGAILRVAIASGKFHGVISRAGPTGRCMTSCRLPPFGAVRTVPVTRTACSEYQRTYSAP